MVADASLREMTDFRGESYGLGTLVVAVQANADSFESIHDLVRALKDAARPGGQTAR